MVGTSKNQRQAVHQIFMPCLAGIVMFLNACAPSEMNEPGRSVSQAGEAINRQGEFVEYSADGIRIGAFENVKGFFYTLDTGYVSAADPLGDVIWVSSPIIEDGDLVEIHHPGTGLSILGRSRKSAEDGRMQLSVAGYRALDLHPKGIEYVEIRRP